MIKDTLDYIGRQTPRRAPTLAILAIAYSFFMWTAWFGATGWWALAIVLALPSAIVFHFVVQVLCYWTCDRWVERRYAKRMKELEEKYDDVE